jgi:predicted lipoprotein
MNKLNSVFSFCLFCFLSFSCSKDNSPEPSASDPVQSLLSTFGTSTALPVYQKLHDEAEILQTLCGTLATNPTDANLLAAQNQWINVREAWELSECMLFGPVATEGLDPAIDTWPVNQVEIDSVLSSGATFSPLFMETLGDGLKGFHPIEYLLFGPARSRKASELTPRNLEYLTALSVHLAAKTALMEHAWNPDGTNYGSEISKAGAGSTVYAKRQDGILEIATAISGIIDEVGAGKIEEPFVTKDSLLEESPFSQNSWIDFTHNIEGARNTYNGTIYETNVPSLHDFVSKYNKDLDLRINQKFDQILVSLNGFSHPFGRSIHLEPGKVQSVQAQLAELKEIMDEELVPLIQLRVQN